MSTFTIIRTWKQKMNPLGRIMNFQLILLLSVVNVDVRYMYFLFFLVPCGWMCIGNYKDYLVISRLFAIFLAR